ncbi:hypothetical protein BGW80DRAFT_1400310 [Lactifluus volemus]|nr:hypothetical protein BGW80DRAFT_1400310 [Lactifluus volemus]
MRVLFFFTRALFIDRIFSAHCRRLFVYNNIPLYNDYANNNNIISPCLVYLYVRSFPSDALQVHLIVVKSRTDLAIKPSISIRNLLDYAVELPKDCISHSPLHYISMLAYTLHFTVSSKFDMHGAA